MKYLLMILSSFALSFAFFSFLFKKEKHSAVTSIYDIKVKTLAGEEKSMAEFKGKPILIVNTASKCGFTSQYEQMQELHEEYGDKIHILGFPCNQFGKQEPGSADDIKSFCQKNYGVDFQMFEKVNVKGDEIHPLYEWLSNKSKNGWNGKKPSWNFCKYVIDKEGNLVEFFVSTTKPTSPKVKKALGL